MRDGDKSLEKMLVTAAGRTSRADRRLGAARLLEGIAEDLRRPSARMTTELTSLRTSVMQAKTHVALEKAERQIKRYLNSSPTLRAAARRHVKKELLSFWQQEFPDLMRVLAKRKT